MNDARRVQQATERLQELGRFSRVDEELIQQVEIAVSRRIKKLSLDRAIGDIHETEIQARAYWIKEAHHRLEGLLRAFVSASYRHGKTLHPFEESK